MQPYETPKQFREISPTSDEARDAYFRLRGKWHKETLESVKAIVKYQFEKPVRKGICGFIFHGEVGTGKTMLAKALARALHVPLYFIDGKDIARGLYGQSEQQIGAIFEEAKKRRGIVLIDDAESVFPDREWIKGQSWHVAQDNVFFHELDSLDSSKYVVVLTTNKYNLLDKAIKSRLYPIEFPEPDQEVLIEIAKLRCEELHIESEHERKIIAKIQGNPNKFTDIREVEKFIIQEYVRMLRKGGNV